MAKTDTAKTAQEPGTAMAAPGAPQSTALTAGKVDLAILAEDSHATAVDLGIRAQDIAMPWIKVAQKMTPQLSKRDPSYIEGIEEGDFFNTVTLELYKGSPGLIVVPAAFKPSYTEWRPRDSGGGLVKDHGTDASIEAKATRNEKNKLVLPNGNHVVPSLMYYALLYRGDGRYETAVLNLAGTQLKKGKRWNALILGLIIPADKSPTGKEIKSPKPWYMSYEISTIPESNDQGDWMGVNVRYGEQTLALKGGDDVFLAAREFAELVKQDKVTVKMDNIADAEYVAETPVATDGGKAF